MDREKGIWPRERDYIILKIKRNVLASIWLVLYLVWRNEVINFEALEKDLEVFKKKIFGGISEANFSFGFKSNDSGHDLEPKTIEDVLRGFEDIGCVMEVSNIIYMTSSGYRFLSDWWPEVKDIMGDRIDFTPIESE